LTDRLAPDFQRLIRGRGPIVVFLPNTNELQRFVWAGAFDELDRVHDLHFVLPEADAEKMMAAAPQITPGNSTRLAVSKERFKVWADVFNAGCVHYASLSPSFALRAGLPVDPKWRFNWKMPAEERAALDRDFDARAAAIVAGLEPLPELLELLQRINPVFCVMPTSLLDLFCNDVVWACEAADVTCLVLQSGWDNMSSKGLLYWRTPLVGVWGPQSAEHANVIQRLRGRRVGMLGAPHYESLRPAAADQVASLRERLGAAPDEKLILFGGSFRQFDETATLHQLEKAIAAGRLGRARVVYRPHPWRAARQHEDNFFDRSWRHVVFDPEIQDRYQREQAEAGFIKRHVPMFDMAYLATLLSAVDAVISPMSTLLIEALIMSRPTMAIAFTDGKHDYNPSVTAQMTHFAELARYQALLWCVEPKSLVKTVARLLDAPPGQGAEARQALIDRVVTTRPGTYARRLAEFCRTQVEPEGRKRRALRTAARRDSISHAYGAHLIAREYCGIAGSTAAVPGYWMHGWIPSYHNVHYALIALHKKEGQHADYDFEAQIREEKEQTVQWVSREDQADFLRGHGYRHVRAIGLPIVYMPPADVARVPGTLLVLPPHSHKNHGPDDPLAERYAEMIAGLRGRFTQIAVGLNEDDMAKTQWVESFRRRGIEVFVTTDQGNPNTLVRLRRILSSFEYVTTNGYGSHIALAAYCGAKVSIWGPFAEFPYDRIKLTHAVKMFPSLLDRAHELCTEQALRAHYGFLFVEPDRAELRRDWAAAEVGEPSRLTPAQMRECFGWELPRRDGPQVLFGMAHAGFVRNFEPVIAGLLAADVQVHIHLSKTHRSISMADYPALVDAPGLTHSIADGSSKASAAAARLRILRDVLLYSRPAYASATDLRARFGTEQKDRIPLERRPLARLLRVLPRFALDALDAMLRRREAAIAPADGATGIIDRLRPNCVVVTPLVNFGSREVDLVKAARRRGIPTMLAAASWDNLTNKGVLQVHPDRVAVWNDAMRREAVELHGVAPERVRLTGAPVFDDWFRRTPAATREAYCREVGFDPSRPIVLYLCSSVSIAGDAEWEVAARWLQALRGHAELRRANVMIRPHPMAIGGWPQVVTTDGRGIARWHDAVVWPLQPKHPTTPGTRAEFFDTLYHAAAVVGLNTSAMIEAAILRKPVLTFLDHDRRESQTGNLHFRHLADGTGFLSTADTLDAHVEQLVAALSPSPAVIAAADRFVERFVRPAGIDRPAAGELVRLILEDLRWPSPDEATEQPSRIPEDARLRTMP
jgi:hypothetical protein